MNGILTFTGRLARASAALAVLLLVGCGGGGGALTLNNPGGIGGTGIKGPVSGATVAAYAIDHGTMGAQIATGSTDAQGNFQLSIGSYSGPVMLQMNGGSYTDEASGSAMSMAAGDVLSAVLPSLAAGAMITGIQMTPLTSMAQTMARNLAGGMTDANIATANTAVGSYFAVNDILHTVPMNPLVAGSGSAATQDMKNYGMSLAAMSQYAKTHGMNSSSALVTAMMSDAADGIMDGKMGGASVMMGGGMGMSMASTAGTTGLATAMQAFISNPAQNKSGVAAATMQALMDKLNGSTGHMMGSGPGGVANTTVSGTAFNGRVSSATITAYAVNSGVKGAQIASVATDSAGNFSLPLGAYAGPVMLQVSGASYVDEATGTVMTMPAHDVMSAAMTTLASGATVTGVWVTPITAMATAMAQVMAGGMSDANIAAANLAMGNYFMVADVLHTQPMNPLLPGSGSAATQDMRNYGMTLAAMSAYAKTMGISNSSDLMTAMMSDASDGFLDGRMGSGQISMPMGGMMGGGGMMASNAGTSGLAAAMTDFMASGSNMSGLSASDMSALMQKLINSSGLILP